MKWILSFLALTTLFSQPQCAEPGLENSVIPFVEKLEIFDDTQTHKRYAPEQLKEIQDLVVLRGEKVRLVSYNMLFNLFDQNLEECNRWPERLPRILYLLSEMDPDVICVQELYADQLADLQVALPTYTFYGKQGGDGEHNGMFYKRNRFQLTDSKVTAMTPDSKTVPNAETLTMIKLKDLSNGKSFTVFNTHLAFSKAAKRVFQAQFIEKTIGSFAKKQPVILAGDFNVFPNRPDIGTLPFLDGDFIHRILSSANSFVRDAREYAALGHVGPIATFTSEDSTPFQRVGTPGVILDRIYVSSSVKVLVHAIQPAKVDGHFPSDHLPVFIDFIVTQQ